MTSGGDRTRGDGRLERSKVYPSGPRCAVSKRSTDRGQVVKTVRIERSTINEMIFEKKKEKKKKEEKDRTN